MVLLHIKLHFHFFPFDTPQDIQQVQEYIPVVNPEKERVARFLDRSGKRYGLPVHGILEEIPVCQQGMPFCSYLFPKVLHVIPFLVIREIEEVMAAQAEQDFRHVFPCAADVRLFIRNSNQIADEFFLSIHVREEIGYEKERPVFLVGKDACLFFGDTAFERKLPEMPVHLPFQLLPGSGDRSQAGEITSVRMETEPVQVSEMRFTDEKEIPGVADGRQHFHVLVILPFRYFPEREA